MRNVRAAGRLLMLIWLVVWPLATAQAEDAAFARAAALLRTPAQEAQDSGVYTLRLLDSAYLLCLAPEIIPFDADTAAPDMQGVTASSSDPDVVAVDASGRMTGLSEGTATVVCQSGDTQTALTVTVAQDAMPEYIKAFLYVVNREYLANGLRPLPRTNAYTKWYYGSNKEVGWCSVFTIWCANAAGIEPIPEEDAADTAPEAVLLLREGQVGNQYDGFARLGRFVGVPEPGYLVIYANMKNAYLYTHIGVVTEVLPLNDGLYQVTTIEGNMSATVKRYTYLYDSNLSNHTLTAQTHTQVQSNMAAVPPEYQTDPLTQYAPQEETWTVFGFCATWLP